MMSLAVNCTSISSSLGPWNPKVTGVELRRRVPAFQLNKGASRFRVGAFIFNPSQERILKEALKEPIAFAGGVFAGLLRLDLDEDPLREWVTRTVEAAGISEEELNAGDVEQNAPEEIEIE